MKLLVLASSLPAPPSIPGSPRLFQFCRHLRARHELTLIVKDGSPGRRALFEADPDAQGLFRDIVYLPPLPPPRWSRRQAHRLRLASNLRTDVRHPAGHRRIAGAVAAALDALGDEAVVHVDGLEMTQYLPPDAERRAVVDLHDCLSYLTEQRLHMASGLREKLALWLERASLAAWERAVGRRFQAVVLNSEIDAAIYRRLAPDARTHVISNGVDTAYYARSRPRGEQPILIFTGVMDYGPNEDAALHFAEEIFPRVRRGHPHACVRIVGANPSPTVQALGRLPGVEVLGGVPDIRPYLDAASVFVCPLRYGAGMKNKVLTALAMELPIVATPTSLANIEVEPEVDVLVADAPDAFAGQVARLLDDPALAARLATRGRALTVARYSWQQRADELGDLLMATGPPAARPAGSTRVSGSAHADSAPRRCA